mgnify:CR=1 FL=1
MFVCTGTSTSTGILIFLVLVLVLLLALILVSVLVLVLVLVLLLFVSTVVLYHSLFLLDELTIYSPSSGEHQKPSQQPPMAPQRAASLRYVGLLLFIIFQLTLIQEHSTDRQSIPSSHPLQHN